MPILYHRLLAGLLMILAALSSGHAQDLRDTLFAEVDVAMKAAREAQAELLAPRGFAKALAAYDAAEADLARGRNLERIRERLRTATSGFHTATEAAAIARVTLASLIKTRADAEGADAERFAPKQWAEAAKSFERAVASLERGSIKQARNTAASTEAVYRDLELSAIKAQYLSQTRILLAEADKARVERHAPKTLTKAQVLLERAEKELTDNRYDTDLPRSLAQQANYEARHAIYLAKIIKDMRAKRQSMEDVILEWEIPVHQIAAAADKVAQLDEGHTEITQELVNYIEDLRATEQRLGQDLNDSTQRVLGLEEEVRELDEKLGGVSEERVALVQRLQAQERIREQFLQVEKMFDRGEARVFRESNTVILRLVGLSFASGQATIDSDHQALLGKVRKAIGVFPQSDLIVEGHTDSHGSDETNMRLSKERADAVRRYAIDTMRIPGYRVSAIGHGETRPVANNETESGRVRNRRIDVVIQPKLETTG